MNERVSRWSGGPPGTRPYVGSTTVSTVNGGVVGLTRSLVEEFIVDGGWHCR